MINTIRKTTGTLAAASRLALPMHGSAFGPISEGTGMAFGAYDAQVTRVRVPAFDATTPVAAKGPFAWSPPC